MKNKTRCLEIRTSEGKVILSFYLYDKEVDLEDNPEASNEEKSGAKRGNTPHNDDSLMSQPQKRYLFRLLLEKGLEGDKAHQYLKDLFQVESLTVISKIEASKAIERLLEENQGGKNDRAPF